MDRNGLLSATRTDFLRAFQDAITHALASATMATFRKANLSNAHAEQRLLLDAHRILQDRLPDLPAQGQRHMEQLVNRSFQTAYSTFRPSFSIEFTSDTLSLVESTNLEDQMRIDSMTACFRNAAAHQLRDLNIRIALLFEQKMIKERENPFRPWLFTRCIANTVQAVSNRADLSAVLSQQIADALEPSVPLLYNRLNAFLSEHDIVAELPLTVRPQGVGPAFAEGSAAQCRTGSPIDVAALPQVVSADIARDLDSLPRGAPRFVARRTHAASFDGLVRLIMSVRQLAAPAGTSDRQPYSLSPDTLHPAEHARVPADVASQQRDVRIPQRHTDNSSHHWLARPEGPLVTLHRFFAGEPALATYGTAAPDARIEPHLDSRVDRSLSPLLARSLQTLLGRPDTVTGAVADKQWQSNEILKHRDVLAGATDDVSEQMTIDVVAMLFEFLLWDKQIPANARAQLGRLQFLILKVALRESTLLTKKDHPTRVLLNQVGTVCAGLRELDPVGTRVNREIVRAVDTLLAGNTESSVPFLGASHALDVFIANDFRTTDSKVGRAVDLLESAQSRTLGNARIRAQLEDALFGLNIDVFLRRFLLVDWVHVIGRAEQSDDAANQTAGGTSHGESDGGAIHVVSNGMRYRLLVADLLWSIVPHADAESRTQLFKRLPAIVRTLREGLTDNGWTAQQQQPILDWLVHAHRCVLHNSHDALCGPTLTAMRQHFDLFIRSSHAETPASGDVALSAAVKQMIVDEAIRGSGGTLTALDTVEAGAADTSRAAAGAIATQADRPGDALGPDNASVGEPLCTGTAVEFPFKNSFSRVARVKWIDQSASALILTADDRDTPALISLRMFRQLLITGRIRFVEAMPCFERAIQAVIQSAASLEDA